MQTINAKNGPVFIETGPAVPDANPSDPIWSCSPMRPG